MKFLIVALAFVVSACADVSELGYNYQKNVDSPPAPAPAPVEPETSYIPPSEAAPAPKPNPVNAYVPPPPQPEPANNYVPPISDAPHVEEPVSSYIPPASDVPKQPIVPSEDIEEIPEDGYHYKTVRRVVYRHRI